MQHYAESVKALIKITVPVGPSEKYSIGIEYLRDSRSNEPPIVCFGPDQTCQTT